jgi:hypothetical protein
MSNPNEFEKDKGKGKVYPIKPRRTRGGVGL